MTEFDLDSLTLADAVAQIKRGELSPVELVEACLARIKYLNPTLNAFLTVMNDDALQQARYAEQAIQRGEDWGALHGVPVALKDIFDTADMPTEFGTPLFDGRMPERDSAAAERLRAAGAFPMAKTNAPEFGPTAITKNLLHGVTRNPWNLDHSPGGSSGGSAAALVGGPGRCPA